MPSHPQTEWQNFYVLLDTFHFTMFMKDVLLQFMVPSILFTFSSTKAKLNMSMKQHDKVTFVYSMALFYKDQWSHLVLCF